MIIFHTIKWKNFLSTGNSPTEIQLDKHSNVLIVGENGSGKSTMLDAICFVWFNRPFRKINKPSLLNSINGRDCVVEGLCTIDGIMYRVVRGIKPAIFEIYKDGILINQDAESRDYQEYLEQTILKMTFKSFTQITVLGSASFTPFMQLSTYDRRAIIEDLLDIQIFSTMNGLLKERVTKQKDLLNTNKLLLESAEDKVEIQQKHVCTLTQNRDQLLLGYHNDHTQHTNELIKYQDQITKSYTKMSVLVKQLSNYNGTEQKLVKLFQIQAQLKSVTQKQKKSADFLRKNTICPSCSQSIDQTFRDTQLDVLKNKLLKQDQALDELEQLLIVAETNKKEMLTIEVGIREVQNAIAGWKQSCEQITTFVTSLNIKIKKLTNIEDTAQHEQAQLVEYEHAVSKFGTTRQELLEEKQYLDAGTILLKDTGIKTKIVQQYLPVINTLVNKYLSALDFSVNFTLDESFNEIIKSRYRDEFQYQSFSEGEKQRIDMALMLTWRAVAKLKNSMNTNLLILDEVFDSSLDNTGAEELLKILSVLIGTNVFVISHRGDLLADKFAHVVRFQKYHNFSQLSQ